MPYLWLKAVHVIFVVAWFAGLFYLPRLFVYHAGVDDEPGHARFQIMERKLYRFTLLNTAIAVLAGIGLLLLQPAWLSAGWLHAKLLLVAGLLGFQWSCGRVIRTFRAGKNRRDHKFYRWYNEIPTLLLFAIVFLVILKPAF